MRREAAVGLVLGVALFPGCTAAHLLGPAPFTAPDPGGARVVVVEPFFEDADWQTSTLIEHGLVQGGLYGPREIAVTQSVAQKPLFAQVASLAAEHRAVVSWVQKLRPSWRVLAPGALPAVEGPVTLVRVVVGEAELVGSDRAAKSLAFGFGFLLPPLWLMNLYPVRETQRVHGRLVRYDADALALRPRLLRYPTQPDFAVDTRGLPPLERRFGLDLDYEEGVLATETSREPVLIEAFARRLAAAVVAIAEER